MGVPENLVEKVFQMHKASTNSLGLLQQNEAIAPILNTSKDTAYNLDFQVIMERITQIMQDIGGMKVNTFTETLPAPRLPPLPTPSPIEPVPLPTEKVTVQGQWPDLDDLIRNMVRRILGQRKPEPREPPRVELPPLPELDTRTPVREPEIISIKEYQEKISNSLKPLLPQVPPRIELEPQLKEDLREVVTDGISKLERPRPAPVVSKVNQMGYNLGLKSSTIQRGLPATPSLNNMRGVNTKILDVVSQRIVGVSLSAASLDVKPAIMENVATVSRQLYNVTTPRGTSAPAAPMNFELNLIPKTPRKPDDVSELIMPKLEREAESKSALIAAEVKRVSDMVAEKGVEVYKSGMENLAPYKTLSGNKALGIAPDLALLSSKEVLEASKTMYELEEASKDIQTEKGTDPNTSAFFLSFLATLAMKGPAALGGHEAMVKTVSKAGTSLESLLKEPIKQIFKGGQIANVGEVISNKLTPSTMGDIGKILGEPATQNKEVMQEFTKQLFKASSGVKGTQPTQVPKEILNAAALAPQSKLGATVGVKEPSTKEGVVSQMLQQKIDSEKAASKSLDKLLSQAVKEPQNKEVVKSTPPSGPIGVSSPKLQQAMPILQQAAASSMLASRTASSQREVDRFSRRPVEVKVEYDIDDIDMKELERKIAKILKEEARRYGVY